jgi:hypothetical protein
MTSLLSDAVVRAAVDRAHRHDLANDVIAEYAADQLALASRRGRRADRQRIA